MTIVGTVRPAEAQSALDAVQAAWTAAATPWNPQALAAVYADDALFFGGRPGHAVGVQAIHDYFASYDGVIEAGRLALVDQHVRELAPGCLLAQGHGDFAFVLAGDRHTRSVLRSTLVLVRQEGGWKIRQHHFSVAPETPPLGDAGGSA